jgi:hypothetical protein
MTPIAIVSIADSVEQKEKCMVSIK